jgi:glycerol-1-phosphate dehydrogenase [NAD(P)+]
MGSLDLTSIKTSDFGSKRFECNCGRTHRVDTQRIMIGKNAIVMLGEAMSVIPAGRALFFSCEDIYEHYGSRIAGEIINLGYSLIKHVFPPNFRPELEQLDKMAKELPEDIRLVVAYGSRSVCDAAKYIARRREIRLIMIPSTPGGSYLSTTSHLYSGNLCKGYKSAAPYALLCDLNVIRQASKEVLASAFGELCSRLVALVDWYFSKCIADGHHCSSIEELVMQCINMAINSGEGLIADNEFSLYITSEALLRSSLCSQLLGYDRCSVGSSHLAAQLMSPKQKMRYGERCIVAGRAILNMYSLFSSSDVSDVFMPPDKDLRARKAAQILGAHPGRVYDNSSYVTDIGEYRSRLERAQEYRKEFLKLLDFYIAKLNMAWVVFKRLYKDAGAWMDGAIDERDLASSIALAPELTEDYTPLSLMRDMGILERYVQRS